MHSPISLDLGHRQVTSLKQLQRLMMSSHMQQAFHLLQVPTAELLPVIEMEIKQNPVLDYIQEGEEFEQDGLHEEEEEEQTLSAEEELKCSEEDFQILRSLNEELFDADWAGEQEETRSRQEQTKWITYLESSITAPATLFEHLMQQASETFSEKKELKIAESLIGNLDTNGFLDTPLEEISTLEQTSVEELETILSLIQSFHPSGVGARTIQESLLIQLSRQGKAQGLPYEIVQKEFDNLLNNRVEHIANKLGRPIEQVEAAIDGTIAKLDLHPGNSISEANPLYIIPDLILKQEEDQLAVQLPEESMPRLRLNHRYLTLLQDHAAPSETKEFIQKKISSARWLLRNILQRNDTLEKIATLLAKQQRDFFSRPEGALVPLTMKAIADELGMHESTIARAVSNKYIQTPRGLFPLRFFFTSALKTEASDISSNTVRVLVKEIIANEDKRHPLSDQEISSQLHKRGVYCARRTVAKYRKMLQIGTLHQRRKFS